jgi:hypothetical protein
MSTSTNRRQLRKEYEIAEELADGVQQLAARRGQSVSDILAAVMQAGLHELGNPVKHTGAFPAAGSREEAAFGHVPRLVSEVDPPPSPLADSKAKPEPPLFHEGGSTGSAESVSV